MGDRHDVRELLELYHRGVNITEHLRSREGAAHNSETAILYAYDVQAGSYARAMADPVYAGRKRAAAARIAEVLASLRFTSMLDAGTGEATTLAELLPLLPLPPEPVLAFDLSLSRLLFAQRHLRERAIAGVELFTAALENIPLADASVDLVLTVHVVEPNGGRERAVLAELLRVARRYLVLIEPSHELASDEARRRMELHGYARALPDHLRELGARIALHEPFGADLNPLNPAAVLVVDRGEPGAPGRPTLVSPLTGTPLARGDGCLFSRDGFAFPVIEGIACLLPDNAVLAAYLPELTGGA
ncbi:MAG TPA: class I SAM-dependent methyltransferase [Kofleriaceae bacterium]|nr:class I SAM-dependent methyltransferase [Kofleriaceae bacterium]